MKTTKMLKKNYEFRHVLSKGKVYSGDFIKAYIIKNKSENNFLGLAVSTKYGKAHQRNNIKRLIRENYKNIEMKIKNGYNIVFIIKKAVNPEQIGFYEVKSDMEKIFKMSNMINMD